MASGKRNEGESVEQYQKRLRAEHRAAKIRLKGKWFKKFEPRPKTSKDLKLE